MRPVMFVLFFLKTKQQQNNLIKKWTKIHEQKIHQRRLQIANHYEKNVQHHALLGNYNEDNSEIPLSTY